MFSISLAAPAGPSSKRSTLRERMLGKVLGFAAGLTLILAVDALFLHGQLVQGVHESYATGQPAMSRAVRIAWASVAGR